MWEHAALSQVFHLIKIFISILKSRREIYLLILTELEGID